MDLSISKRFRWDLVVVFTFCVCLLSWGLMSDDGKHEQADMRLAIAGLLLFIAGMIFQSIARKGQSDTRRGAKLIIGIAGIILVVVLLAVLSDPTGEYAHGGTPIALFMAFLISVAVLMDAVFP